MNLLFVFTALKILKFSFEAWLASLNKRYYEDSKRQEHVCETLQISHDELKKTVTYSNDHYHLQRLSEALGLLLFLSFLYLGGFSLVEGLALNGSSFFAGGPIVTGIFFILFLSFLSSFCSLPFEFYAIFVIEEKHGFNRQSVKSFFMDKLKMILISLPLGTGLLAGLLWAMQEAGSLWWLWAWGLLSFFSLFISLVYPSFIAPLFNKFEPLASGPLKDKLNELAKKVDFKTSGLFIMDASKRSSHGNAYFTGVFGKKRIVLFDNLVKELSVDELLAVLAHELGHFKLNHIRWGLVRGFLLTGLLFYLLSLCLPLASFYKAFYLGGVSNYGALVVFSLWYEMIGFFITPIFSSISRKNEFAADHFARQVMGEADNLSSALLKLRKSNASVPVSHPYYSQIYHSHPPLFERLKVLNSLK